MDQEIFLSYCWNDEAAANQLDSLCLRCGVSLTRDRRDLGYDQDIHRFMRRIRGCSRVILLVSDSYLRSVNCVYEACQLLLYGGWEQKAVPVVLPGTDLFSLSGKQQYIRHWRECVLQAEEKLAEDAACFSQELDDLRLARDSIAALVDALKGSTRLFLNTISLLPFLRRLGVSPAYPEILGEDYYAWLAEREDRKIGDMLFFIADLYRSRSVVISDYPNIPDGEDSFFFQSLSLQRTRFGLTVTLTLSARHGAPCRAVYPDVDSIEQNRLSGPGHSKYYFYCVDREKQRRFEEIRRLPEGGSALSEGERELLLTGFHNVYRVTLLF